MFDETLVNLTFTDIETVGGYIFKQRVWSIHTVAGMDAKRSIFPLNAAKILVEEVERVNRLKDLFAFTIELDGSPLNNKVVKLDGLENMLYRLCRTGQYYDFARRKFVELMKKYKTKIMEKVYYRLWAFLKSRLGHWEGRIWNWAGDGGILAFRGDQGIKDEILEKKGKKPRTMSLSESVHARLAPPMQHLFTNQMKFEGLTAMSTG